MAAFAKNHPNDPIDIIIADYMSEGNMVVAAARKADQAAVSAGDEGNPLTLTGPAFESSFLEALEPALSDLARHGIKVAVNAGASDTKGLYDKVCAMVAGLGIPVGWVSGDEVFPTIQEELRNNGDFKSIYNGEALSKWDFEPFYAQAYLGGMGVAEAFRQGAQIVLCGRVADASPVIGAAVFYHNWNRTQFDQLANAFLAGHLIECSNYVCGGNFSGFRELGLDRLEDVGFPIAEISSDGSVILTKQKHSGGAVTVDTCSAQVLYEIQGPWYFNSDVTAVLDGIWFEQVGQDRVALRGVRSLPPPQTTKVGITARGGYQAEGFYFVTGLHVDDKVRLFEAQIRKLVAAHSSKWTQFSFTTLGAPVPNADSQSAATVLVRVFAQARASEDLEPAKFIRPIVDNADIQHVVHFDGRETTIPPPPETKSFPERQPSTAGSEAQGSTPVKDFGPTETRPLGSIVHGRSGDKASDANCGFWVRHDDEYEWLQQTLTISVMKQLLGKEYRENSKGWPVEIERFDLPKLRGVHFLFRNLQGGGVMSATTVDFLGKNVAEYLRARYVQVPVKFLERGTL
ncbi:hypothetical protein AYO21_06695 [Fonsecaea monophora]|uniref:DUF1446 domain protein n=1 Tax=Fonsecaea monophora TaxID=254056 RepID=A0A177F4B6_9EURO|nr:hypothetical protein AYO21_06695 [Fonsecaea monophora]OAG39144.1 hypothetical protein AYO21_06695 [Fonsecaea monophora]